MMVFRSGFPSSKRTHFGSTAHSIRASGNVLRNADAAGNAWTISPNEPSRRRRNRWSFTVGIGGGPQTSQKIASGMFFGIANNGDANAEQRRHFALRNRVHGVVGSFGVDVRLKFAQQRFHIELIENNDVVDGFERGDQGSTRALGQDWSTFTLQFARSGVGVNADDEQVAFGPSCLQITNVADVQQIEHAIREHDFAARMAMLFDDPVQAFAGHNFFARIHSSVSDRWWRHAAARLRFLLALPWPCAAS